MKQKILFLTLLFISSASARFFLGIEGGYTVQKSFQRMSDNIVSFEAPKTSLIVDAFKNGARGYSVGVVLGNESFYNRYFGMRFGLSAGYTSVIQKIEPEYALIGLSDKETSSYVDAGIEVDTLINFYNNGNFSIGIFGGLEAKYHYLLNKDQEDISFAGNQIVITSPHLVDFNGRVGIGTLFDNHHRLEMMAKFPIASVSAMLIVGGPIIPARVSLSLGYKFIF